MLAAAKLHEPAFSRPGWGPDYQTQRLLLFSKNKVSSSDMSKVLRGPGPLASCASKSPQHLDGLCHGASDTAPFSVNPYPLASEVEARPISGLTHNAQHKTSLPHLS